MVKRFARPVGIAAFGAVTGVGLLLLAAFAADQFELNLWGIE